MSRTYSNYLLFEDVLDNIPTTSPVMTQAVQVLLNPSVKIVEEDCGTLLGRVVPASMEFEGYIETATGEPLDISRIKQLLSEGTYKFKIRTLDTCNSHLLGGICRTCYQSTYMGETAPAVGTSLDIPSSIIYQTDILMGDGFKSRFYLSQDDTEYYSVKVLNQGQLVDPSTYTLDEDFILFNTPLVNDEVTGLYTVHFHKQNTEPFQGYISKTYSGSLLGMQPLPTPQPLLRISLYESLYSDGFVSLLAHELAKMKIVPSTYIDFVDRIHTKFEKVLLIVYLFALYSNIKV